MKFVFIAKHRTIWPVAWLCIALGVSRPGFHAWLNLPPAPGPGVMKFSASESGRALWPATGRMALVVCGATAGRGLCLWSAPDRTADAVAGSAGTASTTATAKG